MNTISLCNVLPHAFRGMESEQAILKSNVWNNRMQFTRPGSYMVEAGSGTGKSSLCSFIYGSRGDYNGNILFDGEDIRTFSIARWCTLRQTQLAYLPQEMNLFGELTALENILIKNNLTSFKSRDWIDRALARLGILDKANTPAARLSVGQQQRVAIVRALCQPFSFLLLDEPVSHLDALNNQAAANLIADELSAQNATIIATSVGNRILLPFTHSVSL